MEYEFVIRIQPDTLWELVSPSVEGLACVSRDGSEVHLGQQTVVKKKLDVKVRAEPAGTHEDRLKPTLASPCLHFRHIRDIQKLTPCVQPEQGS